MISRWKWTKLDWIFLLIIALVLLFLFAGDSGVAHWLKNGLHLLGNGLGWAIGGIQQLVNSVGK